MNYSFETRVKVSHSHSVLLWSAKDGTEAGQNLKYTIRSIVCKAFCHPVIWVIQVIRVIRVIWVILTLFSTLLHNELTNIQH